VPYYIGSPSLSPKALENVITQVLEHRIPENDKRYVSFSRVLRLIGEWGAKIIVETGTARNGEKNCFGDGCSTVIFGDFAERTGANVFSVDINNLNCE